MLHQGDFLKAFKENNLAKVNFLKLLTTENPLERSLAYNLPKTKPNSSKLSRKRACNQSGFFDHQNYVEKSK